LQFPGVRGERERGHAAEVELEDLIECWTCMRDADASGQAGCCSWLPVRFLDGSSARRTQSMTRAKPMRPSISRRETLAFAVDGSDGDHLAVLGDHGGGRDGQQGAGASALVGACQDYLQPLS
jgi:hypothetical protein